VSPVALVVILIFILTSACLLVPIRLHLIMNHRRRLVTVSWFMVTMDSNLRERVLELRFLNQTIVHKRLKKKDEVEEKRKKEVKPKGEKKKSRFNLQFLWEEKELLLQVIKVVLNSLWNILKGIRWNRLYTELEVATPDPVLTGVLYGQLCAVKYSTEQFFPKARILVKPDFINQLPRGCAESEFSIKPLSVVISLSKMLFTMPKIRILKAFVLKKRR
jgi:hypothetical protein